MRDQKRRRPPIDLWRIVTALAVSACLPTIFAFLARLIAIAELLTHFRVQYVVGVLPFLPLLAWKKKRIPLLLVSACTAINVAYIVPLYFARSVPAPLKARTIKILATNVHTANQNHSLVLELIRREDPDVIIATEVNKTWTDALSVLHAEYPVYVEHPQSDNFGIAYYARTASTSVEYKYFEAGGVPYTRATCILGQDESTKLTIFGAHAVPSIGAPGIRERDDYLQALAALASSSGEYVVVAGDLNLTPWSPSFDRFLEKSGLEDGRLGFGVLASWPSNSPHLSIPIDHVLVSPKIVVRSLSKSEDVGSDHFALVAELEL